MITKEQMIWFMLGSAITFAESHPYNEVDFEESINLRAETSVSFLLCLAKNSLDLSSILKFNEKFLEDLLNHAPLEVKNLFKDDGI